MATANQRQLEIQFHKDMLNIYENARKIGYNASRFKQMVANQGGLNVAKKFISSNSPSDGFTSLLLLGRLDLTVEALVLEEAYQSLFSEEERQAVLDRLKEYGFEIKNEIVEEGMVTTSTATVPAIRLLPMSETDPEFAEQTIESLQEWFVNELPNREYNFKKGMNAESGTLVLFQYKGHVIASAILEEKIMYTEGNEGGYRGAYYFTPSSIAVFSPITPEEMRNIWTQFKGFNQSLQKLDVKQYELLYQLLLRKNIRYVLDGDTDEEFFQKQIEYINTDGSERVVDEPKEIIKGTQGITQKNKWKRNALVSKKAIVFAEYKCEYDNSHLFFKSSTTGENYVEAHHLIPIEFQERFENSLDVEANIISLCPLCHKTVHHATTKEIEPIIRELYSKRSGRLNKCNISLEFEQLIEMYH
ncbi:5-methylcytosine-specific restriction enzyme A [Peribacillus asahii]|uniref:5-methylcytosine-specific restriction enzyme A n=1 Tax=Peribacillus asahii TaxID=228899 RepID=A0A3T0KNL5_9BACI|nr:HNH endonuclease [Peribacillus asahii]AZV42010.1 5-methylcytosine-specific restriction enzyme A [Peribacillus asahii]